jgi:hypothetical protein
VRAHFIHSIARNMTVTLVTFCFRSDRYVAPTSVEIATATLRYHLARVREGRRPRFDWPWSECPSDEVDELAWLTANTDRSAFSLLVEESLAQCVMRAPEFVVARYLFDHDYANAHPEAIDPTHLSLAHGTIAAKLFDDGVIALTDDSIRASLRWRPRTAKSAWLRPDGQRKR